MSCDKSRLCMEIMQNCRNQLYHYFPYLDGAFAVLSCECQEEKPGFRTDGEEITCQTLELLRLFRACPGKVTRGYLHMLLHCLYLHIFPENEADQNTWNLACDIAVELVIHREQISDLELAENKGKLQFLQRFGKAAFSAEKICRMLQEGSFPETRQQMEEWFSFDNHEEWYQSQGSGRKDKLRKKWERVLEISAGRKQEQKKGAGREKGDREEMVDVPGKGRYDYRRFLKRFSEPREEVELDLESFDYIFYDLGMREYGNMPLIEPLEYKEVNRLEELVIAIDTSGSCDRKIVEQFLGETYEILSSREHFFRKMNVYLIQCDCCIQDVRQIYSEEEWKQCSRQIRIQGRGGTDFRPVFSYVEQLRKKKELKHLKALIYFTDGDGIYPQEKTEYETAFVFLNRTAKTEQVPAWAGTLYIQEDRK